MSEVLLHEYLKRFAEQHGLRFNHAMLGLRGEREPGFREAFVAHLRAHDGEDARTVLKLLEQA
jgi:hypothetical protein